MPKYEDFTITVGEASYQELRRYLVLHGYNSAEHPSLPGEFTWRGNDRLVIMPAAHTAKLTVDFFGNNIEGLKVNDQPGSSFVLRDNRLILEDGTVELEGWVVHAHYGIGKYQGRRLRTVGNEEKEFVVLLYAGGDQLYVPAAQEQSLMPYLGGRLPKWTRLHSTAWQNTKKRIVEDLVQVARDLILTQAAREVVQRPPHEEQPEWQDRLEKSFAHDLTDDQRRALNEITHDLCGVDRPMDRLLSGDVGFGKTEVAIRAAATVLGNGGSVLVLAPTTVLVEQHYHVWSERLSGLPVKVLKVSRLHRLTAAERQAVAEGAYDVIIGTHQLFSIPLPRNAALMVIDEEQRFGVRHKEHFKKLRAELDVLSLSATPIPRTLYLGISGVREMSVIRTPPWGRQDVETEVSLYSDKKIIPFLHKELKRQGQVYYVHNRVQTLGGVVKRLDKMLFEMGYELLIKTKDGYQPAGESPTSQGYKPVRAAVVHGQSPASWLAEVMDEFFGHTIDILISTAIVENGLDNPRANTLIVERAELFGLADLYQLRGRVGRRDLAGQALLLIGDRPAKGKRERELSTTTRERLAAIAEASAVGSGWELALKDLELRGAGTILGKQQHGNLEAIGLVLYGRLLRRVVEILKDPSSSGKLAESIMELWQNRQSPSLGHVPG